MPMIREIYSIPQSIRVEHKQKVGARLGADLELICKGDEPALDPNRTFRISVLFKRAPSWPDWFEEALTESVLNGPFWKSRKVIVRFAGSMIVPLSNDIVESVLHFTMEYNDCCTELYQRRRVIDCLTVKFEVLRLAENNVSRTQRGQPNIATQVSYLIQCLDVCMACLALDQLQQRVPLFKYGRESGTMDMHLNKISDILGVDADSTRYLQDLRLHAWKSCEWGFFGALSAKWLQREEPGEIQKEKLTQLSSSQRNSFPTAGQLQKSPSGFENSPTNHHGKSSLCLMKPNKRKRSD